MSGGFNRARALQLAGGMATVVLAIIAVSPTGWGDALTEWSSVAGDIWPIALGVAGGGLLGALIARYLWERDQDKELVILEAEEYEMRFRESIEKGDISLIKVFGYTGEVVLNNLMRYEDRYRGGVELRLLHRNWVREREDEQRHNAMPSASRSRPWRKSEQIRQAAVAPWDHALAREIRYYEHPPVIRGVVLCGAGDRREAFVTFLNWTPTPEAGGSPHKGAGLSMLHVPGETDGQRNVIRYLESQFDREWAAALTRDEMLALDEPGRP